MHTYRFGIILGSLGRQGSPNIFRYLQEVMDNMGIEYIVVLLSEIFPDFSKTLMYGCRLLALDCL